MMKNGYWTGIAVGAFVVGILFGYLVWGARAGRLAGVEQELAATQAQMGEMKKKMSDTELNLGKVTNEKLTMEKELSDMKEAAEKASKTKRK
jgi:uncharacterized membrane-anchored protein YhcB (DUF1043 family)